MKTQNSTKQKFLRGALIIGLVLIAGCFADTKMYIGNENDQFIVGIESMAVDVDAGVGMEIRTYFPKKGFVINGIEYGHVPGKTLYTATLAGKTEEGTFARYRHKWLASFEETDSFAANTIELGYGQGDNILTH